MPTQDLTRTVMMPAHAQDLAPTVMVTAHAPVPAATLAGGTAMGAALRDFQRRYLAYAGTAVLDGMRARDYTRLDATGHIYLDYTGGGLYAESQLARHQELLAEAVFGNPHSQNVPSRGMGARVEAIRAQILAFFRASPEEYEVIFTPNATGALRLVGESYPFGPGGRFLLTFDNHNSVNGIRQFARAKGASVTYVPLALCRPACIRGGAGAPSRGCDLSSRSPFARRRSGPAAGSLFAFPAQSNFSGVQHPLAWIAQAQDAGYDVLLDAAAFAPASPLDLSRWHPDYVSLSFYKIFGYPTGIGALLVRRPALASYAAPGTPAARSPSLRREPKRPPARGSTSPRDRPALRTAPSTTWASRPSASAWTTSARPASRPSTPGSCA